MDPERVQLIVADFWVHTYDLPCRLLSKKVIRDIGNFIGTYMEADPKNFDGNWKVSMRARITLDVTKPLKRK